MAGGVAAVTWTSQVNSEGQTRASGRGRSLPSPPAMGHSAPVTHRSQLLSETGPRFCARPGLAPQRPDLPAHGPVSSLRRRKRAGWSGAEPSAGQTKQGLGRRGRSVLQRLRVPSPEAIRWGPSDDCMCCPSCTPKSVQCLLRIVHRKDDPGAGFGRPAERQREGNKNQSGIEKDGDGETEGKGNRKRAEAEPKKKGKQM